MEFPPPPPPPPAPKKKTGLIIGIVVAALACLCLVVIAIVAAVVLLNPGLQLQLQGTQYTSSSLGFSIYYPKNWIYEEGSQTVTFATTQDVIDTGPLEGAGLYVIYLSRQDNSFLPDNNVDPNSPEDLLDAFVGQQIQGIQFIQPISSLKIGGYPAASAIVSIPDSVNNLTYTAQMAIAVTPNTYYFFIGACPDDIWSKYAPTFKGMLSTMKIFNP